MTREMQITCELSFAPGRGITAKQAKQFEDALTRIAKRVFPKRKVTGLWVHSATSYHKTERA